MTFSKQQSRNAVGCGRRWCTNALAIVLLPLASGCLYETAQPAPPGSRLQIENQSHHTIDSGAELDGDSPKSSLLVFFGPIPPGKTTRGTIVIGALPTKITVRLTFKDLPDEKNFAASVPENAAGKADFPGDLLVKISDDGIQVDSTSVK